MSGTTRRRMRTGQVAEALGLAAETVRGYAREGRIPATPTPGGQYRFDLDEVRSVLYPQPLQGSVPRGGFIDPFVTSGVLPGSTSGLDESDVRELGLTGYVRGPLPQSATSTELASTPALLSLAERHRQTRRGAGVLAGTRTAAFSVLG